jgi:cell wall-associated NlpC family hydrolase
MTAPHLLDLARQAVVAQAQAWVGTPYHAHARIKGVGVDCAQILAAVYHAAGLVPDLDLGAYSPQWHLHHSEELYLGWLQQAGARRLADGQHPQAGDVGVWRFGRTYSHGAIVVEGGADPLLVHAYIGRGVIVSRASEAPLAGRLHCWWGVI